MLIHLAYVLSIYNRGDFMKHIDLMKDQATAQDRSYLFLPTEPELPKFKGKNIPFLSNISETALADLMRKAKTVKYVRNEMIASDLDTSNSLFLIFLGKVSVTRNDAETSGKEVVFQIHEPTTSFSELAVLTDELRSVSTIALKNTVFSSILKTDFDSWLLDNLDVKFAFLPVPTERLNS